MVAQIKSASIAMRKREKKSRPEIIDLISEDERLKQPMISLSELKKIAHDYVGEFNEALVPEGCGRYEYIIRAFQAKDS